MQDFKNGGLRLINVVCLIEALKAGWIRRIFDENNKKNFMWRNLTFLEGNCYWNVTYMFTIVIRLLKLICSCEMFEKDGAKLILLNPHKRLLRKLFGIIHK